MIEIAGIRFKRTGKIYYFDPVDIDIKIGDYVIVETVRGLEFGAVELLKEIDEESIKGELKPVIRLANQEDKNIKVEQTESRKQ